MAFETLRYAATSLTVSSVRNLSAESSVRDTLQPAFEAVCRGALPQYAVGTILRQVALLPQN